MPYVSKYGNQEQREKYIPNMTAGKVISAIAMTEPDAGRYSIVFFLCCVMVQLIKSRLSLLMKAIFKGSNHSRGKTDQITFSTAPKCSSPTVG